MAFTNSRYFPPFTSTYVMLTARRINSISSLFCFISSVGWFFCLFFYVLFFFAIHISSVRGSLSYSPRLSFLGHICSRYTTIVYKYVIWEKEDQVWRSSITLCSEFAKIGRFDFMKFYYIVTSYRVMKVRMINWLRRKEIL